MKIIYYWAPFISKVATVKAVINSGLSLSYYSNYNYNIKIINAIGEWDKELIHRKGLSLININKNNFYSKLPRYGFLKSRISYLFIYLKSFFPLLFLLKKNKPDFLILHLITSLPLTLLLLFKFNTKFILRISGLPKLNFFRKFLWKCVSHKIYLITCPTVATLQYLQHENIFSKEKLIYLPDPIIDIKEYIKKVKDVNLLEKNFSKEKSLLAIGRLTNQKNFIFLIKCFKRISEEYNYLNLFIIGDGEEKKKLFDLINNLNLVNKVFILGHKDNVFNYLNNCKCFLLTSLWEDPGFVLVEAGIANATVISSNCPNGPIEILENGKNGFIFQSNSVESFISSFNQFINTKEEDLKNKKLNLKKKIRLFTKFNHYKILNNYLIK